MESDLESIASDIKELDDIEDDILENFELQPISQIFKDRIYNITFGMVEYGAYVEALSSISKYYNGNAPAYIALAIIPIAAVVTGDTILRVFFNENLRSYRTNNDPQ